MTYCPNCGTTIVVGQSACTACGRQVYAPAPPPGFPATAIAQTGRPKSVTIATGILVLTMAISFFGLVIGWARIGVVRMLSFPMAWLSPFLLLVLAVTVALIWSRQGWARIVLLVLMAWTVSNLSRTLFRVSPLALATPLSALALRVVAVWLLFRKESNDWFRTP